VVVGLEFLAGDRSVIGFMMMSFADLQVWFIDFGDGEGGFCEWVMELLMGDVKVMDYWFGKEQRGLPW
jgi:hypothetical protein